MAEGTTSTALPTGSRSQALILVWGPPSHGPRSRVLARELGLDIEFIQATERRGLLVAPYKYARQTLATVRCLARRRPRTVLVQSPPSILVLVAYLWSVLTKGRYLVDAHSDAMDTSYWTRPRWLHRHLTRRATVTVVTNEHYAERIHAEGGDALVIRDVPTTFELGPAWPTDGTFRVTVVNSFAPDEPLAEIMAAATSLPEVSFLVTGSPRRAPPGLVDGAPPNVTFTGYLPDDHYYALLASSDAVMCLTTRDHTMQRGACEALSLGRPIITSRWPLLQEYFRAGAVHVENDAASIVAGVQDLRRERSRFEAEIVGLRAARLEEWQRGSTRLRGLLVP